MQADNLAKATSAIKVCLAGLLLFIILSGSAYAENAITSIDVANKPDRVVISVQGNCALKMTPIISQRGSYIGFQFPFKLASKGRIVGISSGKINNVKYSAFSSNPPATRIVVNTSGYLDYCTDWSSDKKTVNITIIKFGATPKAPASEVKGIVQEVATASAQPDMPAPEAGTPAAADITSPIPAIKSAETKIVLCSTAIEPALSSLPETPKKDNSQSTSKLPAATKVARLAANTLPAPKETSLEKSISLNFLGADINDVLKALSVQSGKNIVSSKEVAGNITVSLSNVSLNEAMDYVARLSGYSYTKLNDTYLVGSRDSINSVSGNGTQDTTVEVVSFSYMNLNDLLSFIGKEFPSIKLTKGNGEGDKKDNPDQEKAISRGGFLILSGTNSLVDQAKSVVSMLDEQMKDLMGNNKTEVYRIKHTKASELAAAVMSLMNGRVQINPAPTDGFDLKGPGNIAISSDTGATINNADSSAPDKAKEEPRARALLITGKEADVAEALALAASLDVKTPQIKIEAKVTSLTKSGEKKLGLSWNWDDISFFEGTANGGGNKQWKRQPIDFGATLDAIINDGDGQLLAAPHLMCLEGKPGVFFVGDEVRYIISIEQTDNGRNISTETANVGVQLRVVGSVSPDGYITLNLHPEVSVLNLSHDNEADIDLPIITRRFTDHVVRVKDGDTLVIGGLIRDEDLEAMSKVPLLGDLPFLGKLFRHRNVVKDHSEVVIFITASIVDD